jgi:methyl-accepting chemotaxis protein
MNQFLKNLKLSKKLLLAPAVVMFFLFAFGLIGYTGLKSLQTEIDHIYNVDFRKSNNAQMNFQKITEVQGNVFKFIAWARAGYSQTKLDALNKQQIAKIVETEESLRDISKSQGEGKDDYLKAINETKEYQKSVANVMDLATFDLNMATMGMGTVEDNFTTLFGTLDKLAKNSERAVETSFHKSESNNQRTMTIFFFVLILSIVCSTIVIRKVNKIIASPLGNLNEAARKVSNGDLRTEISVDSTDELGSLAGSFKVMIENLSTSNNLLISEKNSVEQKVEIAIKESEKQRTHLSDSVVLLLNRMDKFSKGDLTVSVEVNDNDEIGQLFGGFNKAVKTLHEMFLEIHASVNTTTNSVEEITSGTEEVALHIQGQSNQTSEVASAIEEMTRTIAENSKNINNVAESAKEANQLARHGESKVNESIQGMSKINESTDSVGQIILSLTNKTDQIGEIAQVIDDIADQTNLLALNAAIEAARAGEQGRGFAVVADEVRKLAERTTKATKEIAFTIKAIQTEVNQANNSMAGARNSVTEGMTLTEAVMGILKNILGATDSVSKEIDQVAAATEEQSSTAEQISKNVEIINDGINNSASGIQNIAKETLGLRNLSENLRCQLSTFTIGKNKQKYTTISNN